MMQSVPFPPTFSLPARRLADRKGVMVVNRLTGALCTGGVAREDHIAAIRAGAQTEHADQLQREWRRERRGSLRTLNQIATGLALRMLEDYLSARLHTSCWLRLTYEGAVPHLRTVNPARPLSPCLCPHAGGGDESLASMLQSQRPNFTLEPQTP